MLKHFQPGEGPSRALWLRTFVWTFVSSSIPVWGEVAAGLGAARLQELPRAELPHVGEAAVRLAPGQDVFGLGVCVQFIGSNGFSNQQTSPG